jgi:cytochrome c
MDRRETFAFLLLAVFALILPFNLTAADTSSLYKDKCAACHGMDGAGKTAAGKKMETPDLRTREFVEMSDSQMFESIGRGTRHRNYPHSYLYTGLHQQQINDLVIYIRHLQKK